MSHLILIHASPRLIVTTANTNTTHRIKCAIIVGSSFFFVRFHTHADMHIYSMRCRSMCRYCAIFHITIMACRGLCAVARMPWKSKNRRYMHYSCRTLRFFSSPTYSSSSSSFSPCSFTCLSFRCFCFYLKRSHHFLRNENMFE